MKVYIGVDPHKLSVTIEVVDDHETVPATGRFSTDNAGWRGSVQAPGLTLSLRLPTLVVWL